MNDPALRQRLGGGRNPNQGQEEMDLDEDKYRPGGKLQKKLAYLSLFGFFVGFLSLIWYFLLPTQPLAYQAVLGLLHLILSFSIGKSILPLHFIVWCLATGLGMAASAGIVIYFYSSTFSFLGAYIFIMALFHFGEYFATGLTNPSNLSTDSFLLNHSVQYWMAAAASWTEFMLEVYLLPISKSVWPICIVGIGICLCGDLLRKVAMFHAGRSFSHIVQSTKREDHRLVTNGVFSIMRHPSYVGWFFWSIGTQIILCNPVCFVIYAIVSWKFFDERIYVEELNLLRFFGVDYYNYQKRVPTGIPFIKGFDDDNEEN